MISFLSLIINSYFLQVFLQALLVAIMAMSIAFAVAKLIKEIAIVDIFWGLSAVSISLFLIFVLQNHFNLVKFFIALLIVAWGLRLALHLTVRIFWQKKVGKSDWRYHHLTSSWQKYRSLQIYLKIFVFQASLMTVLMIPVIWFFASDQSGLYLWGFWIWLFGFIYESIADAQLLIFQIKNYTLGKKSDLENNKFPKVLNTGLWRFSQHPNYFGEILVWWGVFFLSGAPWWAMVSPLLITYLLVFVSGVAFQKKTPHLNPQKQEYQKVTPVLIPFLNYLPFYQSISNLFSRK